MGSIPRSTPGTFRRLSHIVKISPTRTVLFLSSRRRSDSSCNLSECLRPEDAKNKKINVMIEQLRPSVRITIWSNNPQDFEQLLTHAITVESGLSERPVKKEEKTEKSAREISWKGTYAVLVLRANQTQNWRNYPNPPNPPNTSNVHIIDNQKFFSPKKAVTLSVPEYLALVLGPF